MWLVEFRLVILKHPILALYPHSGPFFRNFMHKEKIKNLLDLETIPTENEDISYFLTKLNKLGFFEELSENRKVALIALCCIYGFQGIINQTNLMLALEAKDYPRAAKLLLDQGLRYQDVANVIKSDKLDSES